MLYYFTMQYQAWKKNATEKVSQTKYGKLVNSQPQWCGSKNLWKPVAQLSNGKIDHDYSLSGVKGVSKKYIYGISFAFWHTRLTLITD